MNNQRNWQKLDIQMKSNGLVIPILLFISLSIYWISKDFILFWDSIQFAGHHPQHFFDNGFSTLYLPNHLDSGHFPLFGIYLSCLWMIFERALWVSHFAMIPFVFLNFYFAYRIGVRWLGSSTAFLFPIFLIFLPQSISQFLLISPDVVLLCCFLGLIFSIEKESPWLIILLSVGLVLISNRGLLILLAIVAWILWNDSFRTKRSSLLKCFGPALILFFIYHLGHIYQTGWVGFHSDMPWSSSFALISPISILRNVAIYSWRLLDFGFVFIWLGIGFLFISDKRNLYDKYLHLLFIIIVVFAVITIPFEGLMQHRYFLPIQVLALFLFIKWSSQNLKTSKKFKTILSLTACLLILGNSLIYPDKIAQGWDSTLAHLPYYSLQKEVITYLSEEEIPKSDVATAFPLRSLQSILNIDNDNTHFANKDEDQTTYLLYSNIMNDFTDEEIDHQKNDLQIIKEWKKRGIKMILYKK